MALMLPWATIIHAKGSNWPNKYQAALEQVFQRAFFKKTLGVAFYYPLKRPRCFANSEPHEFYPKFEQLVKLGNTISKDKIVQTLVTVTECKPFTVRRDIQKSSLQTNFEHFRYVVIWEMPVKHQQITEAIKLINEQSRVNYKDLEIEPEIRKIMTEKLDYSFRSDAENKFEEWRFMDASQIRISKVKTVSSWVDKNTGKSSTKYPQYSVEFSFKFKRDDDARVGIYN